MKRLLVVLLLALGCTLSFASSERRYIAPLEESKWTLIADTPVLCAIEHVIPYFGKAVFYQESGRSLGLRVIANHHFKQDLAVAFRSVTANWRPRSTQAVLADLRTGPDRDPLIDVVDNAARQAYFELQQGFQPSLFFVDEEDGFNQVSVILSTVRFRDVQPQFSDCLTRLHARHFDDVRRAVIRFDFDEEFPLLAEEEQALKPILDYLQVDPAVNKLVISGHTDFKGSECYNETLSARRAWYVYDLLVQSGVDPAMLEVNFYGETRPQAKERTDAARAINRRVTVEMQR